MMYENRVDAFDKMINMVWNIVISKNFINQIVMNLATCVLEVQQRGDLGVLFDTCFTEYI